MNNFLYDFNVAQIFVLRSQRHPSIFVLRFEISRKLFFRQFLRNRRQTFSIFLDQIIDLDRQKENLVFRSNIPTGFPPAKNIHSEQKVDRKLSLKKSILKLNDNSPISNTVPTFLSTISYQALLKLYRINGVGSKLTANWFLVLPLS